LFGPVFLRKWTVPERSLGDLLYLIRTTMPYGAPASLPRQEYADVLAYLLQGNGTAAGQVELSPELPVLDQLSFPRGVDRTHSPQPARALGASLAAQERRGPTQEELNRAHENANDWLYATHDYLGRRYAELAQITPENAHQLRPACVYQAATPGAFHTNPLVYQGSMYFTTRYDVIALDAQTCRPRWRWSAGSPNDFRSQANRGVALKAGRLVVGTADGRLVALDAETGTVLWDRQSANKQIRELFTMPPLIFEDLVIIGPAGSEYGIRGWVGAFRLSDGEPVWRFNVIPLPGEPGSETWHIPESAEHGGGATWTPFSLDPRAGRLYVSTTNPAPDFAAQVRPGENLYTNSLVVLDARTGKLLWYKQLTAGDTHDWDLTQAGPLFSAPIDGKMRDLVAAAGKDGVLRVLDRRTHEILHETPVTTRKDVELPLTPEGVHACPGSLGGVQWNGAAYHPRTNLLYVPSVDWCSTFRVEDEDEEVRFIPGTSYMGGSTTMDPIETSRGWLHAIDASTGQVRWRYSSDAPMVGAVTATAGGIVFAGEISGDFLALDASTGRVLHRFYTGGAIGGGVISYRVHGRQYVAVMSGGMTSFWQRYTEGAATVFVFALP
jgi:alcohol dehydrogenase (cytochrome c)